VEPVEDGRRSLVDVMRARVDAAPESGHRRGSCRGHHGGNHRGRRGGSHRESHRSGDDDDNGGR